MHNIDMHSPLRDLHGHGHEHASIFSYLLSKSINFKSSTDIFFLIIISVREEHCYALQENFVADHLFQSSEHCLDDLLGISHSILSSSKVVTIILISLHLSFILHLPVALTFKLITNKICR